MIYLATPFSRYWLGHEAAFIEASRITGALIAKGLHVFSPIVHSYPLAEYGKLDMMDAILWQQVDKPYIDMASCCFVAKMSGWQQSEGVTHEIETFKAAGKPVFLLNPISLEVELLVDRECVCQPSRSERGQSQSVPGGEGK